MLLGLGFRNLSMSAAYMFQIKRVIRSVTIADCEAFAAKLLTFERTHDAENYLIEYNREHFPFMAL